MLANHLGKCQKLYGQKKLANKLPPVDLSTGVPYVKKSLFVLRNVFLLPISHSLKSFSYPRVQAYHLKQDGHPQYCKHQTEYQHQNAFGQE